MERDGSIIACAALFPFFEDKCGEVAAIAVSPECRGLGQGDKLLGKLFNICILLKSHLVPVKCDVLIYLRMYIHAIMCQLADLIL